jgi:hypothetical protein
VHTAVSTVFFTGPEPGAVERKLFETPDTAAEGRLDAVRVWTAELSEDQVLFIVYAWGPGADFVRAFDMSAEARKTSGPSVPLDTLESTGPAFLSAETSGSLSAGNLELRVRLRVGEQGSRVVVVEVKDKDGQLVATRGDPGR